MDASSTTSPAETSSTPKRKTTTRKRSTTSKTTAAASKAASVAKAVEETKDAQASEMTRKKEFIEAVVARSGQKPGVVKKVVEAAFEEMGERLDKGESLNIPPLGKITVNRSKQVEKANILFTKLRRVIKPKA